VHVQGKALPTFDTEKFHKEQFYIQSFLTTTDAKTLGQRVGLNTYITGRVSVTNEHPVHMSVAQARKRNVTFKFYDNTKENKGMPNQLMIANELKAMNIPPGTAYFVSAYALRVAPQIRVAVNKVMCELVRTKKLKWAWECDEATYTSRNLFIEANSVNAAMQAGVLNKDIIMLLPYAAKGDAAAHAADLKCTADSLAAINLPKTPGFMTYVLKPNANTEFDVRQIGDHAHMAYTYSVLTAGMYRVQLEQRKDQTDMYCEIMEPEDQPVVSTEDLKKRLQRVRESLSEVNSAAGAPASSSAPIQVLPTASADSVKTGPGISTAAPLPTTSPPSSQ
jgi:hypothetical protein